MSSATVAHRLLLRQGLEREFSKSFLRLSFSVFCSSLPGTPPAANPRGEIHRRTSSTSCRHLPSSRNISTGVTWLSKYSSAEDIGGKGEDISGEGGGWLRVRERPPEGPRRNFPTAPVTDADARRQRGSRRGRDPGASRTHVELFDDGVEPARAGASSSSIARLRPPGTRTLRPKADDGSPRGRRPGATRAERAARAGSRDPARRGTGPGRESRLGASVSRRNTRAACEPNGECLVPPSLM